MATKSFGTYHDDVMMALEKRNITRKEPPNGGSHKTIEELIAGLDEGGISWDYDDPENMTLVNSVAVVTVLCEVRDAVFELYEDHRIIITPRSELRHVRSHVFNGSIGEKIKAGKTPLRTAVIGLIEELSTDPELLNDHAFKQLIGAERTEILSTDDPRVIPLMGNKRFADSRWHESFESDPQMQYMGPQASEFWSWLGFEDIYERNLFTCKVRPELFKPDGLTTVERKGPNKIVKTVFRWRNHKTKKPYN